MGRSSSLAKTMPGLILGLVGILNVVLGIIAISSSVLSTEKGDILISPVGFGAIFFGLLMFVTGGLWVISGIGHLVSSEGLSKIAFYVSPFIIAVNVAGVFHLWGFNVNIGWAIVSMVTGVGFMWYLSKRELSPFFLISVAEHVFVIMILAMMVYAEPVETISEKDEIIVALEEIKQKEQPKLKPILKKPERKEPERKEETPEKLPVMPKIDIQSVMDSGPGSQVQAPKLPNTFAKITDPGADSILRSPGIDKEDDLHQDIAPDMNVESVLKETKKPSPTVKVASPGEKGKSDAIVTGDQKLVRSDVSSPTEQVGPSSDVVKPGFIGDIKGEIAGRRVLYWPKSPEELKGTERGSTVLEITVDPAGNVIKVKITKKSGSPKLDRVAMKYMGQVRFEELPKNVPQKIQRGEVVINFELAKGS